MKDFVFKCLLCDLEGSLEDSKWYKLVGNDNFICENCRIKLLSMYPPQDIIRKTLLLDESNVKLFHPNHRFEEIVHNSK
jgi:hypothetical protein